jgi:hypothetical protein
LWFYCCVLWYFFLLSELIKYSLIVFFVLFGSRFVSWCWCVCARVCVCELNLKWNLKLILNCRDCDKASVGVAAS